MLQENPRLPVLVSQMIQYRDLVAGMVIGLFFSLVTFMVGFYAK